MPEGAPASRRALFLGKPTMPKVTMVYLLDIFYKIGPALDLGGGYGAITYTELSSWVNRAGVELSSWESEAIVSMSKKFLNSFRLGRNPSHPNPLGE